MRITTLALVVLLFTLATRLHAAPIVIDGFSSGSISYSADGANVVNGANQSGVDTVNGLRATAIDHLFAAGTATLSIATGGPLTISGDNHAAMLGYGATYIPFGMTAAPDMGLDLSSADALDIHFASGTNAEGIQVQMFTHYGNGSQGEIDNNGHGTAHAAGAGDAIIPFSALTNSFNGGVNFAQIDSIIVNIQSQGTYTITQISAVPEPATASATLALCAAALTLRRRRRRVGEVICKRRGARCRRLQG